MKKKLAIVITHPIQYYTPVFRMLSERKKIEVKVFFTWHANNLKQNDSCDLYYSYDIPLLDGYDFVLANERVSSKRSFFSFSYPFLKKKLERWKPDAILVFAWNYYAHLTISRFYKSKIPVYFRGDSTTMRKENFIKGLFKYLALKKVYSYTDIAFSVGTESERYFLKYGLKKHQIVWAPHAIDNNRFKDPDNKHLERAVEWRKKLGLHKKDIVVGFVGVLKDIKNPGLLVEAINACTSDMVKCIVVGSGPLFEDLQRIANDKIKFIGFQNQSVLPAIYRMFDVLCLPSRSETWGLVVNEAFACKVPAIVSDMVACSKDLVHQGRTGWVFKEGDQNELKALLESLPIITREGLSVMGNNAFNLIQDWSFEKICEVVENQCIKDCN